VSATLRELRQYLGSLTAILWNLAVEMAVPTLDQYRSGHLGFDLEARLPGSAVPRPATIRLAEIWAPAGISRFHRREYAFDLIDYPRNRRRAFHGHDPDHFAREFGVLVHEHCEENLGAPDCSHYFGLPMDGFQAIDEFTRLWSQPAHLGCAGLPCMG
jgi:hypothetical protein